MEYALPEQAKAEPVRDRRSGLRLPRAVAIVQAHRDDELDAPVKAQLVEVSVAGMKLYVGEPIAVGTHLSIDTGGMMVMGDVRYCEPRADQSWAIGLMMSDIRALSLHARQFGD